MKYELKTDIPVVAEADVVVVGGGPGGISAAVTAARNGAKTILIERYGQIGGMASMGEVQPFMPNHINHKTLDRPFYMEWIKAMRKYLPDTLSPVTGDLSEWSDLKIEKNAVMLAAEDLCLEAGVHMLYHHTLFDVVKENRHVKAVVLHSKSGLSVVTGKVFIDSTGDGDLAAKAGCGFEYGDGEGGCQPMTLCFKMTNVDDSRRLPGGELSKLWKKAKSEGKITDAPNDSIGQYEYLFKGTVHFNQTRVCGKNPLSGVELSEAETDARRQLRQLVRFLNENAPGYEHATIHSIASSIGVRESRRVLGKYYLTVKDYDAVRKFPDAVVRVNYPVDIHSSKGAGFTFRPLPENEWYEIPYGCLVTKDMDNLLIASRCVSSDHVVNSSLRVMPVVASMGQAAGMAAAMSVKSSADPASLDGIEVRRKLVEYGARLGDFEVKNEKRLNWDQP